MTATPCAPLSLCYSADENRTHSDSSVISLTHLLYALASAALARTVPAASPAPYPVPPPLPSRPSGGSALAISPSESEAPVLASPSHSSQHPIAHQSSKDSADSNSSSSGTSTKARAVPVFVSGTHKLQLDGPLPPPPSEPPQLAHIQPRRPSQLAPPIGHATAVTPSLPPPRPVAIPTNIEVSGISATLASAGSIGQQAPPQLPPPIPVLPSMATGSSPLNSSQEHAVAATASKPPRPPPPPPRTVANKSALDSVEGERPLPNPGSSSVRNENSDVAVLQTSSPSITAVGQAPPRPPPPPPPPRRK